MTHFLALAAGLLAVLALFGWAFILGMRILGQVRKPGILPLGILAAGLVAAAVWLSAAGAPSVGFGAGVGALIVVAVVLAVALRSRHRKEKAGD
jgi:hypothetical protein